MNIHSDIDIQKLKAQLESSPVIGEIHPLLPICLAPDVRIESQSHALIDQIDDRKQVADASVLVLSTDRVISQRFNQVRLQDHPPVDEINQNLAQRLDYIRTNIITSHQIAHYIETDVGQNQYEVVVLLLVDGLSYGDVLDWGYDINPCFIDGPSVTFAIDDYGHLNACVGFASIVGNPGIAQRLYDLGYHSAFGYTYWRTRENIIARYMFRGIPDNSVENFEDILDLIAEEHIPAHTYIQIVRQGLDGLAHSRRELRQREILSGIKAIHDDIERLAQLIMSKSENAVIYVTADHGILWKNDHEWRVITQSGSKVRYSTQRPGADLLQHAIRFENCGVPYYLYELPYLGASIKKNDSGVHGGLSYHESFVPFIKIEVN